MSHTHSQARIQARTRNYTILRLRGMWAGAAILLPDSAVVVRREIDKTLEAMGAESETARWARISLLRATTPDTFGASLSTRKR